MQELVDENGKLTLHQAKQHTGRDSDVERKYEIEFSQIYLSKPSMTESDGTVSPMLPSEARLRNLTCAASPAHECRSDPVYSYSAPLFVDISKKVLVPTDDIDPATGEAVWVPEQDEGDVPDAEREVHKQYIGRVRTAFASYFDAALTTGQVPIMLWSDFCLLNKTESTAEYNECQFDRVSPAGTIRAGANSA
jgi:DNA-directed RNA polymerase II subunit RPB2